MFKNEAQRAEVCKTFLRSLGLEHYWGEHGPTDQMIDACTDGAPISSGQLILLRVTLDLWNGHARTPFDQVLYRLDARRLYMLGTFMETFGLGPAAIDRWLDLQEKIQ